MGCRDGIDPADFSSGVIDPADEVGNTELSITNVTVAPDPDGSMWARFTVLVSNINFFSAVEFRYDTANGSGIAGTHYIAQVNGSGHIPIGENEVIISVPVVRGTFTSLSRTFFVNISNPVNAVIANAQGMATVYWPAQTGEVGIPQVSVTLAQGLARIRHVESGSTAGNYTIQNAIWAYGAYQYMPLSWRDKAPRALGTNPASASTGKYNGALWVPSTSVANQDAVATWDFTRYVNAAGGDWRRVAVAHQSGWSVGISTPISQWSRAATLYANSVCVPLGYPALPVPSKDPGGTTAASLTGWAKPGVVYDQFSDCRYKSACTGFAGAAVLSGLYRKSVGAEARFNAKKLFADAGGTVCNCSNCPGYSMSTVLQYMRNVGTKIIDKTADPGRPCNTRDIDTGFRKIQFQELGGEGITKSNLLTAIKKAIAETGSVYMASIFYSNWNRCRSEDAYILRPHGTETSSTAHAWALTGWNDNKTNAAGQTVPAFEVQSSHGCDWGAGGRGWIPYSYLTTTWPGGGAVRYRYWRLTYVG